SLLRRFGLRTGRRLPLLSPEDAMGHELYHHAQAMPTNRIIGAAATVVAGLEELAHGLRAAEIMLAMPTFGVAERLRSFELIAERWNRSSTPSAAGS
ncbi:MAG: alkanal monooxygenase, partial [Acidimicrobiia bacterium]|nr:alkanal monooxygenase [Acidimicrobiia bacterium]